MLSEYIENIRKKPILPKEEAEAMAAPMSVVQRNVISFEELQAGRMPTKGIQFNLSIIPVSTKYS
jgi:hypothetical protein